jgi:mannosyltransferase OCH1-like enzyme
METEIPKKIYICHKDTTCLKMTYTMWKKMNPDYEICLFDDSMCEQFLLKEYSQLHHDIFKFIPDGPIKSDFWRICILYHKGGIYVDADIHPLIPLSKYLILTSDFVTCITQENRKFNPHFIAVKNKELILKLCIDEYVSLYTHHKHSYSYWNWSIVNIFNKYLSALRNTTVSTTVFKNKKFQFFIEKKKSNFHATLHDYYCVFNNIKIFNTRYANYDPHEHKFKNETCVSRNDNNTNSMISDIIHLPKNIKHRRLGKKSDNRKIKIVFQSRLPPFIYR